MNGHAVSAYLLHSVAFQDQKLLLDLLIPAQGRVRAVARRPAKKHSGRSTWPLFCLCWVELTGQGELRTVRRIEEQQAALALQGEWLFSALYLNELICRLFPANALAEELFEIYQRSVQALWTLQLQGAAQANRPLLEQLLRQTELALLQELGIAVDCSVDAEGAALQPDCCYQWQHEYGFVAAVQGWSGADLLAISAGDWHSASLRCAKQLNRQLLQPLLGHAPLLSRQLFRPE
jgi:DNA repair protein RecO (recombination protein O)